ncbi:PIN domain-containing protein [Devosia sp.]|uniref:PIN domain-containing protein n=1 Tax=Devosia sp. TaxID=1871048 RepID=UPI003A8D2CA7
MQDEKYEQNNTSGMNILATDEATVSVINFSGVSAIHLASTLKSFILNILKGRREQCLQEIKTLKLIKNISENGKNLLRALEYIANIKDPVFEISRDEIISILNSVESDEDIKDFAQYVLIRSLFEELEDKAIAHFKILTERKYFTELLYLEKFSDGEYLESVASKKSIYLLNESELCAMVYAYIRLNIFEKALEMSNVLFEYYPNENSVFLKNYSKVFILNEKIKGGHFWTVNADLNDELQGLIKSTIEFDNEFKDGRNARVAAVLLVIVFFQNSKLINIVLNNIDEAKKVVPEISNILELGNDLNLKLSSIENITFEDFIRIYIDALLNGKLKEISSWLDGGGDIHFDSSSESDCNLIDILKALVRSESNDEIINDDFRKKLSLFLTSASTINPMILFYICLHLNHKEKYHFTIMILKDIVFETPWASPVIELYAEALFSTDQLEVLHNLLNSIQGIENSFKLLNIKIRFEIESNNISLAKDISGILIDKYPDSLEGWYFRIFLLYREDPNLGKETKEKINNFISDVPKYKLLQFSNLAKEIVRLIAPVNHKFCEEIATEWFIDDPEERAIDVTEILFSRLFENYEATDGQVLNSRCLYGVNYLMNGREFSKLVIDGGKKSSYFIDRNSHLGNSIDKASDGEEFKIGGNSYKLKSKIPASVAVYRMAVDLRNDNNLGDDCFYKFYVSEDDVKGSFLDAIGSLPKHELLPPTVDKRLVPLLARVAKGSDYVKQAHQYLTSKESNSYVKLYNDELECPKSFVADVVSIVYLALGGFGKALSKSNYKIFISKETKAILDYWIKDKSRSDYFSIGVFGEDLIKYTSESLSNDCFLKNIKIIFNSCNVLENKIVNVPEGINCLKDNLDPSHYASIKLSLSHKLEVLCVDFQICEYYKNIGVKVANIYDLVKNLKKLDDKNYVYILNHAVCDYPTIIYFEDLVTFLNNRDCGIWAVSNILMKHRKKVSIMDLSEICSCSILGSSYYSLSEVRLSEERDLERLVNNCCFSSMFDKDDIFVDKGLAIIMASVILKVNQVNPDKLKLLYELFERFIKGHFLSIETVVAKINLVFKEIGAIK